MCKDVVFCRKMRGQTGGEAVSCQKMMFMSKDKTLVVDPLLWILV
jgi:hypothetical protein